MTLNIDMTNPSVQNLLGSERSSIVEPGEQKKRREMVQIAGDPEHGYTSTTRLDTMKQEVFVTYKDFLLTVDVYALPGQPIELVYVCPKCRHQGRITGDRKHVEFDPSSSRVMVLPNGAKLHTGGDLSVEAFQCSWEMPDAGEHKTGIRAGGITLCNLKIAIDHNIAKDA